LTLLPLVLVLVELLQQGFRVIWGIVLHDFWRIAAVDGSDVFLQFGLVVCLQLLYLRAGGNDDKRLLRPVWKMLLSQTIIVPVEKADENMQQERGSTRPGGKKKRENPTFCKPRLCTNDLRACGWLGSTLANWCTTYLIIFSGQSCVNG
jgi:hypothetical protein